MSKETISYWNGTGKYQDVQKVLWSKYVPTSGESSHPFGEVARCLGRLWHEYCNNGNGNARESSREVNPFFDNMLECILKTIEGVEVEVNQVRDLITNSRNSFSQKEMNVYNDLTNKCLEFIIEQMNIDLDEYKLLAIEVDIKDAHDLGSTYQRWAEDAEMKVLVTSEGSVDELSKLAKSIENNLSVVEKQKVKVFEFRQQWKEEKLKQIKLVEN